MKEDTKYALLLLLLVLLALALMAGLLWVASAIAKHYGFTAGMMAIFLPIGAATAVMIVYLIKSNKGEKQ